MDSTAPDRLRSIKLWPPSHNTRLVLVQRIVKNLTTPSILSRKYGLLSKEEAEDNAKQIESSAFKTATHFFENEPDGDGGSAVQLYAKETSKLMVETVKKGPKPKADQEPVSESEPKSLFDISGGKRAFIENEDNAKQIESSAFKTATHFFENEPDGDGGSAVQLSAKETSKLMVETVKKGPKPKADQEPVSKSEPESLFDISGGKRAFIEADEAKELLKPLIEPGNKYTKICFSNRSFGLEAARIAANILSSINKQLTEVDLSDFIAGKPEAEAIEVMKIFSDALNDSDLRSLNLSNNALGEKGVRAFGQLLSSQSNLEELFLMNNGISEEAAKAVCELIPSTKKLKILHFHNNMTGDDGAIAIAGLVTKSPSLEDFRCSSTRVDSVGGVELAESLASCVNLKKLDLRDNMFGVEAGIALSKTISVFSNLTKIYLSYLNLENEGGLAIINALKNSVSALEVLEMAGNDITFEIASVLADCLTAKKHSLTKLNLSENELKDEGIIVIANVLKDGFEQLTEVDLSANEIRTAGARVLSQAVIGKPGFKLLNINGNFLSDEGVDYVKEMFKDYPSVLGPLDENDPEGEQYDDEDDDEDDEDNEDELESKLEDLEIKEKE